MLVNGGDNCVLTLVNGGGHGVLILVIKSILEEMQVSIVFFLVLVHPSCLLHLHFVNGLHNFIIKVTVYPSYLKETKKCFLK